MTSLEDRIAAAFTAACRDELAAPKPGNVHVFADGHGMTLADFEVSAQAAAAPIAERGAGVGARILGAVAATRAAVGQNTNLGIVLLCAPLARAAELGGDDLRRALADVLAGLDTRDAALAFQAIALAAPGGLGRVERHDVFQPAQVTLRQAMAEAADRDRIAYQYATTFDDIFTLGLALLEAAMQRWNDRAAAALAVHLGYLAALPDSHILRKQGEAEARGVRTEAIPLHRRLQASVDPAALYPDILAFDARLKARGVNPGTTADLTVATLFAFRLRSILPAARNSA